MPLYEYKCQRCGKTFEVMQKFSDTPLSVHEDCGGELEKLISAPSFQFKGTGWYVTDYGRGDHKPGSNGKSESHSESHKESHKDSKTEAKGETKSEAKSETKSETKTESKAPAAPSADK